MKTERRCLAVKKRLLRQSYQQADRVLAVSASTADDASRFYDLPRERFEVIPSPIDCQRIDRLLAADEGARGDAALTRLPDRQREAIVLCHYQELTNIEAAALMAVSVDALESLLSRGRRALRLALADIRPCAEGV